MPLKFTLQGIGDRVPVVPAKAAGKSLELLGKRHIDLVVGGRTFQAALAVQLTIAKRNIGTYHLERQGRAQEIIDEMNSELEKANELYVAAVEKYAPQLLAEMGITAAVAKERLVAI